MLKVRLEHRLEKDPALRKLFLETVPYFIGKTCAVHIESESVLVDIDSPYDDAAVEDAVIEAYRRTERDLERVEDRILLEYAGRPLLQQDVFAQLVETGQVIPTATGKVSYTGRAATLFAALNAFLENMCVHQGAEPEIYPPAVNTDTLKRAGYFRSLAQHAYFVSPLDLSLKALQSPEESSARQLEHLQEPTLNLSPTVCHHCFEAYGGTDMTEPRKITAMNACSRYEVASVESLARLRMYWMREFVHFDRSQDNIRNSLDSMLAECTQWLERWEISYRVSTASDPFFAGVATSKKVFQGALELKRELQLPYYGGHLACASFNNHQQSLTSCFGIKSADEVPASGCVAWGLDRLMLCLYSHLGIDTRQWPDIVRSDLILH